jgi:hypothetical protein
VRPRPETRAGTLRATLAALPLRVDAAHVTSGAVAVGGYPGGGPRPTSVVCLAGGGHEGTGEHVGWTAEAHAGFAARVREVAGGRTAVGAFAARLAPLPAHDRAALEAAAIDLALRQAGTTLARAIAVDAVPVRYVVSATPGADPSPTLEAEASPVEWKLDVHPAWRDAAWATLAAHGRIAVLDWKGGGDAAAHARAAGALAAALHEDPGDPTAVPRARLAADAPLTSAAALATLAVAPAAVNVKPARTGGVLEALALAAAAGAGGALVYLGGMWEVGCARRQLLALAAVLCPDAPNDIAPLAVDGASPPRPPRLAPGPDVAGFG